MATPSEAGAGPAVVVRAVIDLAIESIMSEDTDLDRLAERLAILYSEPTYVVHPLSPDLPPLVHLDDFRRHALVIRQRMSQPTSFRAVDITTHATTDPEVVVTEFRYEAIVNGATLIMPCIWVTRVRDGRIVEARDYNGAPHPA